MSKILIVEDEPDIAELLAYNLHQAGFETITAFNGEDALRHVNKRSPDLILLDLLLPGVDGLEICRMLKGNPMTADIPVIMLTAKGEKTDRIVGLELGADDYTTKPFSPREVVLRIRAVQRRMQGIGSSAAAKQLRIHDLVIDLDKHQVFNGKEEVDLTATEFKLLTLLEGAPGRVFTRDLLMNELWGDSYFAVDRTVDTHISRLRRKLGELNGAIDTVRGIGYRFKELRNCFVCSISLVLFLRIMARLDCIRLNLAERPKLTLKLWTTQSIKNPRRYFITDLPKKAQWS